MRPLAILLIVLLLVLTVVENEVNSPEPTPEAVASAPAHRARAGLLLAGLIGFGFTGAYLIMRRGRGDSDTAVTPKTSQPRQNRAQKRRRRETGITIDPARFR